MKIGKKIILGFLTVLVLTGLIAKIALKFQDKLLNLNISREILEKEKLSDVFIRNEMRALSYALEVFVQDQTIKDLYLEKDREKLYQHGKILFEDISTKYGITHVYFILPDGHCFLRLHDKDLYNDKITRVTFEKARDTKTMVSGVELGKTAFALRVVKPYYNGNELIGYVEFGEEINIFLNNLKDSLISENLLIVNKRFLDKEKWSAMRKIEGLEDNWNDFGEHVLVNNIEGIFLEKIKKYIGANINILVKGKVVVEEIEIGNKSFYLGGFHFKDVKGEEV
ncbi:MAG: hypothetical protein KKF78_01955, partial [Candidatus Omnitrophica bacterium]|nr:hypothetical protein [Candidatus Omnitrophota bacterium]